MKHAIALALAGVVTLGSAGLAGTAHAAEPHPAKARAALGQVSIVQAVPDDTVSVTVDGRSVRAGAPVGSVLGPLQLTPGDHTIGFTNSTGAMAVSSKLTVKAGSNSDVVLHRPAAVGADPVISAYTTPMKPIGPGKSRVLIAHTATVAPADVRVDGKVVFRNIANGEYATADVSAGRHAVALFPTGVKKDPLLGPINVQLKPRTVTMVYAVGNPKNKSMQVIAHVVDLRPDGSVAPDTIDTGSAGLAAGIDVRPFSAGSDEASAPWLLAGLVAALVGVLMVPATLVGRRRARRAART